MMLADWRSSLEIGSKASNRLDKYVEGMRWLSKTNRVSGSVDSGCDLQETRDLDGGGFDDGDVAWQGKGEEEEEEELGI
jgi:hypothetical protein